MKTNVKAVNTNKTHEGGQAGMATLKQQLERAVATTMLFENTFYESGSEAPKRIEELCRKVGAEYIAELAVKARNEFKLRHAPLFLLKQLEQVGRSRKDGLVSRAIAETISRPDEIAEFAAMLWADGHKMLSNQVKKGLNKVFNEKFDLYQWQKWDRDGKVKLKDVMKMSRPKAKTVERNEIFHKIINGTLGSADTWEVGLAAAGSDVSKKKKVFEDLLNAGKLPYMALVMNLRKMTEVGVDTKLISDALIKGAKKNKLLPFRFITAANHNPAYADQLDKAMVASLEGMYTLKGRTAVVLDVSGSMWHGTISAKSEVKYFDAGAALAVIARECGENARVFTFSNSLVEVKNFRGLALINQLDRSQGHGGTDLRNSLISLQKVMPNVDRIVVITDEQSHNGIIPGWGKHNYILNVANYKHGLETSGGWQRINGFSERFVDYMVYNEAEVPAQGNQAD